MYPLIFVDNFKSTFYVNTKRYNQNKSPIESFYSIQNLRWLLFDEAENISDLKLQPLVIGMI